MIRLICSAACLVFLLSGCGSGGTPTRHNDFVPLTSIRIVAVADSIETSKKIAVKTSTTLKVIGDYSGLYTRDITSQVTFTSDDINVASFKYAAYRNRIYGVMVGTTTLHAVVGDKQADYTLEISSATISTIAVTPATPSVAKGLTSPAVPMNRSYWKKYSGCTAISDRPEP